MQTGFVSNQIFNVGLYIRLSKEDGDVKESESVINQKSLLLSYVREKKLRLIDVYIDDGYSGLTFDRPGIYMCKDNNSHNKININKPF